MTKSFHAKAIGICLLLVFSLLVTSCTSEDKTTHGQVLPYPKNVIILIGDGMGYDHVNAANYYTHGAANAQIYEQADWVKLAQATYPAIIRIRDNDTTWAAGYNPRQAWADATYAARDYTDSGAGGTALSTAEKVYSGSIGIGIKGDTLLHISQAAKNLGKSIGVVSSVPLSHATPASFLAHNEHRNNYAEIAQYMLFHTRADVIMAPGNPDFNDNAQAEKTNARYVGGEQIWEQLKLNDARLQFETDQVTFRVQDANGNGQPDPWTLIQTREEFLQLVNQTTNLPKRVLGVPQVASTLQQNRSIIEGHTMPFQTPLNEGVPSLEEMTRAALNVLSQNKKGFFVMIEGGAIDWASHSGQSDRAIEEQIDFNHSIQAVVNWVETHSNWDETLVIVTADHECGYLTGPGEPNSAYPFVVNNGKGQLPGMQWNHSNHTNVLVPIYAKGPGAELFYLMAEEKDPVRGDFLQNTEIPQLIFMLWGKPEIKTHRLR